MRENEFKISSTARFRYLKIFYLRIVVSKILPQSHAFKGKQVLDHKYEYIIRSSKRFILSKLTELKTTSTNTAKRGNLLFSRKREMSARIKCTNYSPWQSNLCWFGIRTIINICIKRTSRLLLLPNQCCFQYKLKKKEKEKERAISLRPQIYIVGSTHASTSKHIIMEKCSKPVYKTEAKITRIRS